MNLKEIHYIMSQPIDSNEVAKILGENPNIVMLRDISKMVSLNQVFKNYDYALLFVSVNGPNDGHWYCMYKNLASDICIFDSYGMSVCEMISRLQKSNHDLYGQNYNLQKLITDSPFFPNKVFVNKVQFQKDSGNPETCGRYAILNIVLNNVCKKNGINFTGLIFKKLMDAMRKKMKMTYDEVISYIIPDVSHLQ